MTQIWMPQKNENMIKFISFANSTVQKATNQMSRGFYVWFQANIGFFIYWWLEPFNIHGIRYLMSP